MRGRYCSIEGCSRIHYALGLCQMHWERQHRTGEVGGALPTRERSVRIQTWGARCVLCGKLASEGVSASDARDGLDRHLAKVHGIEVES